jgi:predicted PurR-regulated permease PerM
MKTKTRILLTVLAFIIGGGLIAVIQVVTGSKTTGWMGAIIGVVIIAALSAIWKKNPDKGQSNPDDKDK